MINIDIIWKIIYFFLKNMFRFVFISIFLSLVFPCLASAQVLRFVEEAKIHDSSNNTEDKEVLSIISISPYKFSVQLFDREIIYDFLSNYQYEVNHGEKTYSKVPLYHVINYRGMEKQSRESINKMLQGLEKSGKEINQTDPKNTPDCMSQFELEMMFSTVNDFVAASKIVEKAVGQNTKFYYNNEKVAEVENSSFAIPAKFKNMYYKYILYTQNIHPHIIEKHIAEKKLFKKLEYRYKPGLEGERQVSITTMSNMMIAEKKVIGVPKDYLEKCSIDEDLCELYSLIEDKSQKVSQRKFIDEIDEHLRRNDQLTAFLTANEYMLQYGIQSVDLFNKIFDQGDDDRLFEVVEAINHQPSKEEAEKAIAVLEKAAARNTKKGYMLYIFMANHYFSLGKFDEGYHYILKALQKNPFIVGAYVDLSKVFFEAYDTEKAWYILDLAYKINPEHYMNKGAEILKDKLRQKHPEYF